MALYTELSKVHKIVEIVHVHVSDHGIYEIVFFFFREKSARSCGVTKEVRCARPSSCQQQMARHVVMVW